MFLPIGSHVCLPLRTIYEHEVLFGHSCNWFWDVFDVENCLWTWSAIWALCQVVLMCVWCWGSFVSTDCYLGIFTSWFWLLANRAGWLQPSAGGHCAVSLCCSLLLGNRSCAAIGRRLSRPHPEATNCWRVLVVLLNCWSAPQRALPTGNCQWGTTGEAIQPGVSGVLVTQWRVR